ncbi:hypothetical protein RF11_02968 [Thelohanellus kitauei]|uniref:Phospholipase/carboxylesterase/thioesterase domain-containing protein n=1 Tax=Thelohanellus kitauei TaxID=669202 RepID=A0A0C2N541_THEKT|nr:hypothetical protein RF11_02968 [Thelohanellus kitauei]
MDLESEVLLFLVVGSHVTNIWLTTLCRFYLFKDEFKMPNIKIFVGHGTHDNHVEMKHIEQSVEVFKVFGLEPQVHYYQDVTHVVTQEMLRDVESFITGVLATS